MLDSVLVKLNQQIIERISHNNNNSHKGEVSYTMDNKQLLDDVFTAPDNSIRIMENKEKKGSGESKPKPHVLRRNIEDYLERKALEKKLTDLYDDDFPLD